MILMLSAQDANEEIRDFINDYLAGRISYLGLINKTGWEPQEIDEVLAGIIDESLRRNRRNAILRN